MTALLLLLACGPRHELPTTTIQVGEHDVLVEVAATPDHRAKGLMHRDSLPRNEGMLFVYPEAKPRSFWMKNTRIPLSIAYADRGGKIVKIADLEPFSTDPVPSLYPAQYALEMNRGWFERNGVETGDAIRGLPEGAEE